MMHYTDLADVVRRDPRYSYEAYQFVDQALKHTQKMLGRDPRPEASDPPEGGCHVSGRELLDGIRDLALREFGLLARTVFHMWGIHSTDDFGEIVFNLVESNMMSKTEDDVRSDFHNVFDFEEALVRGYHIHLEETE